MSTGETSVGDPSGLGDIRYNLSSQELGELESSLGSYLVEMYGDQETVYAVWVPPESPYANIIRTNESVHWPTMDQIMEDHEENSFFLVLFDTRNNLNKVVHGFRTSKMSPAEEDASDDAPTGLIIVDDIITSGQGFSAAEFRRYYADNGVDLSKCTSVETNMKILKTERFNGLPLSQVGYISLFLLVDRNNLGIGESTIFASLNKDAIVSLGLMGAEYGPIAGREDLKTPVEDGKFDDDYRPVAIPATERNLELFRGLVSLAAEQVYL